MGRQAAQPHKQFVRHRTRPGWVTLETHPRTRRARTRDHQQPSGPTHKTRPQPKKHAPVTCGPESFVCVDHRYPSRGSFWAGKVITKYLFWNKEEGYAESKWYAQSSGKIQASGPELPKGFGGLEKGRPPSVERKRKQGVPWRRGWVRRPPFAQGRSQERHCTESTFVYYSHLN